MFKLEMKEFLEVYEAHNLKLYSDLLQIRKGQPFIASTLS